MIAGQFGRADKFFNSIEILSLADVSKDVVAHEPNSYSFSPRRFRATVALESKKNTILGGHNGKCLNKILIFDPKTEKYLQS